MKGQKKRKTKEQRKVRPFVIVCTKSRNLKVSLKKMSSKSMYIHMK